MGLSTAARTTCTPRVACQRGSCSRSGAVPELTPSRPTSIPSRKRSPQCEILCEGGRGVGSVVPRVLRPDMAGTRSGSARCTSITDEGRAMAQAQARPRSTEQQGSAERNGQDQSQADRDLIQRAEVLAAQLRELVERLEQTRKAMSQKGAPAIDAGTYRLAQANLELMNFWGRRARATMHWPARLVSCTGPQDLWAEHSRLVTETLADAQATLASMMKLWGQAATGQSGPRSERKPT